VLNNVPLGEVKQSRCRRTGW